MRAAEVHLYAIIVLTLCHLDEALHDLVFSATFKMKPAKENLCARHLSLDLADTDAVVSTAPSRRPLDMTHEETTRTYCSLAIEVSAEPLRCKDGSAAMFALASVSGNTGACPSCGNPICRPKEMAPPFPPHPSPFTVRKTNTCMQIPTCTRTHWTRSRLCKCTWQWQHLCPGTYLTMHTRHPYHPSRRPQETDED